MHDGPMNHGPPHDGPRHGEPMNHGPIPGGPMHPRPMHGGPLFPGPMHPGPMLPGPPFHMGHRMPRHIARRIIWGDYILFGAMNSLNAYRLYPWQLAEIEAYYHCQAEMLSEAQLINAMNALHYEQMIIDAEQQFQFEQMDIQAPTPIQVSSPVQAGSTSAVNFCPNCGTKILNNANFCEHCGQKLH